MKDWDGQLSKVLDDLSKQYAGIRAGNATPELIQEIKVKAYGNTVNLKEVGSITIKDNKTLAVTCWDEGVVKDAAAGIQNSGLGFSVSMSDSAIMVGVPELTMDKRKQYVKMAKEQSEKAKVAMRGVRQTAMKTVKGLKDATSEDFVRSMEQEVEKLVKKSVGEVDQMMKKKDAELLKV